MSVRISLTLEASEMFLSLHMIFSLESAAVVWAILERISGFDPSLEKIAQRYLKFSTSSSLWPFILISLWKPLGCLSSFLSCLHFVPGGDSIKTFYQDASLFFLFCITTKRKLVMSHPPTVTLPSWSSNASHMILSWKIPYNGIFLHPQIFAVFYKKKRGLFFVDFNFDNNFDSFPQKS